MGEDIILLPGLEGFVYKGPTYLELNEKLESNPLVYNLIQQNIARRNNPTKEIVSYKDANGNTLHTTNVSAGVLSPVDPLAEFYVAGKVLDPAFKLAGKAGEYGILSLADRTSGVIDLIKYGIKDRILGRKLYSKYLRNNKYSESLEKILGSRNIITDESGMLFMQPATYTRSDIISTGPYSIRMGFTPNIKGSKLSKNLVLLGKSAIDDLPAGTSISADAHGISIPSRLSTPRGRKNPTKVLLGGTEDAETTLSRLEKKYGEPFIRNPYDMSADAHRFFTIEALKPGRELVYAGRSGKFNDYAVSNPLIYLWQQAYEAGSMPAREYVQNYNNWVKLFNGRPGHIDLYGKPYFYHPTIFITHKQGGKMNTLQFLKNGSGIHIKKENRGKFTDYCGGKVTSECIAKGKRSSDPAIRKRAAFASNARKWKHLEGGTLNYEQWQLMTPELKTTYNKNIAKSFLSNPTLPNLYNSVKAYFGGYAPKNPYLQTGIAPSPGMSSKALALLGKTQNAYNVERLLSKKSMLSGIKIPVETIKDAIKTGDVPLVSTKIVEPIKEAGLTIRNANPVMLENYISNPAERAAMLDFKAANPNVYVGKTKMPVGRPSLKVMKEIMYPLAFQKWLGKSSQPLKTSEKIVKSEAAKLNSVEQGYSKTRRSKDKIERAFEYTDARHANAGQSRIKKANENWILDIIEKEGGPWGSKLLYFRRKMADSERGSIRYNNGKQGIKQLIADYKKLRGYKKGGKAFVKGVSILDSNPDAYKYVKKKLHKAADGDNTLNWQTNSRNTLNVFGKSVLEQLPSIVGAFQSSSSAKLLAKANELSDDVSELELFQKYYLTELENLLKNPTQFTTTGELINNSPIVAQTQAYLIAWNKAKAEMEARRNKTKQTNALLLAAGNSKITNAITGAFGNLAQTGLEYLNYKKSNKNNSSLNTSGTSNSSSNYDTYAGADGMA